MINSTNSLADLSLEELQELNRPATDEELQGIGFLRPDEEEQNKTFKEKAYEVADELGVEHPDIDKEYQQLNKLDTAKDVLTSFGVEASHFFMPKSKEWQYESKTKFGERVKYGYRYLAGTASLFNIFNKPSQIIKGAQLFGKAGKIGSAVGKLLGVEDIIKTGVNASKGAKLGAKIINSLHTGALAGAVADYNLYRPEEEEGHLADVFGKSEALKWLQTDENDTEHEAKLKNVVEGLFVGAFVAPAIEVIAKPLLKSAFKNIKALTKAQSKEEAKALTTQIALDEVKIDKIASKADLYDSVKGIKEEAEQIGQEASELIIERLSPTQSKEAHQILDILNSGHEPYLKEDGTWCIQVKKWDDAYKVTPEEFKEQLAKQDMFEEGLKLPGDTAIEYQDEAVRHTWVNRGWIGENEELTSKAANNLVKRYKDGWKIDNNIKVEFVDGLKHKGNAVEGLTQATEYLGKGKKKIPNIVISIDKSAKNPYATLRSELEHARDIAKGTVPNQKIQHFSRYQGLNEAEVAPDYVYKKSQGKAKALNQEAEIKNIQNNVNQYEADGYTFEVAEGDGWGEQRYNLKDNQGNGLGYIEYTIQDDILTIDYINNTTKRFKDRNTGNPIPKEEGSISSIPNVAEKLVDKVISEHPDLKIEWNAVSEEGFAFKEKYLSQYPKLKNRVEGVSTKEELDIQLKKDDNSFWEGANERSNNLQYNEGNRGEIQTDNSSSNSKEIRPVVESDKSKRTSNTTLETDLDGGHNSTGAGKQVASHNSSAQQLKLDFNAAIETKHSTDDIVSGVINGEVKIASTDDIETILTKTIELDPEISGKTWKDIAKDGDKLAETISTYGEADISAYKEAFIKQDAEALSQILRRELAANKVISSVIDKFEIMGTNVPIEVQRNYANIITQLSSYIDSVRSGAGALLQGQKLVNRATETFGSRGLSQLEKEGLNTLADLLDKEIKKVFNLSFTRGQAIDNATIKKELFNKILNLDESFPDIISNDKEFARELSSIIDNAIKSKGQISVNEIYQQLEDVISLRTLREAVEASKLAPTKAGVINTLKNWTSSTLNSNGGFSGYYVNNLLSSPKTGIVNVLSGVINTGIFPAQKMFFTGLGESTAALRKEGWNTYKVMLSNLKDSWDLCCQAFKSGKGTLANFGEDTLNMQDEAFRGFHSINDTDPWHIIQNIHSLIPRFMGASDEFLTQLNYRSITKAKCLNQADELAKLAGKEGDENWINSMADDLFKKQFTVDGKPLDVDAFYEAKSMLYQTDLNGKMFDNTIGDYKQMREQTLGMAAGQWYQQQASKSPVLKILAPFVRTGTNIMQSQLDYNPLYAILSPTHQKLLASNTKEGIMARARLGFGTVTLTLCTFLAANNQITGAPPTDSKEREALFKTGWRPYSIKVGDTWYSYQGIEPIHGWLGFAADCVNMAQTITNNRDEEKLKHFVQQGAANFFNNFVDKAAFRNGLDFLSIVTNPERLDELKKTGSNIMRGFLPASSMVNFINTLGHNQTKAPDTVYQRLFNNYFPEDWVPCEYRRDVFGNRQDIYGMLVTTAAIQGTESEYEELGRLAEMGFSPTEISEIVANTRLKFKDFKDPATGRSAYDVMQEELSTLIIDGKTLREAIRELVETPAYQSLPDGINGWREENSNNELDFSIKWGTKDETKANAIREIFREYNDQAKENVLNSHPDFIDNQGRILQDVVNEIQTRQEEIQVEQNLLGTAEKLRSLA